MLGEGPEVLGGVRRVISFNVASDAIGKRNSINII
jgi:hypothetical protein